MTRMAGLLRNNYEEDDEDEEIGPSPDLTEDDQLSEGTFSELDPQLLRLKHLFLKQKEKWLWERARETTRRHKIQKLQRLIAERVRRHRSVDIDESLDTATLSSSILSDLEDTTGQGSGGPAHAHQHRRSNSFQSQSTADTLTADATPRRPQRKEQRAARRSQGSPEKSRQPRGKEKEAPASRTKPPIIKMKKNRQIQVSMHVVCGCSLQSELGRGR